MGGGSRRPVVLVVQAGGTIGVQDAGRVSARSGVAEAVRRRRVAAGMPGVHLRRPQTVPLSLPMRRGLPVGVGDQRVGGQLPPAVPVVAVLPLLLLGPTAEKLRVQVVGVAAVGVRAVGSVAAAVAGNGTSSPQLTLQLQLRPPMRLVRRSPLVWPNHNSNSSHRRRHRSSSYSNSNSRVATSCDRAAGLAVRACQQLLLVLVRLLVMDAALALDGPAVVAGGTGVVQQQALRP